MKSNVANWCNISQTKYSKPRRGDPMSRNETYEIAIINSVRRRV